MSERGFFSGRKAFILATAASAVGLGNIWRFPTMAAQHGGGAFLLAYIIVVLLFGVILLMTEIALGRRKHKSPVDAFEDLDKRGKPIGLLATLVPAIIAPYYCVICAWILGYLFGYCGGMDMAAPGTFGDFIISPLSAFCLVIIFAVVAYIIYRGVTHGIEKISVVFMPLFIVMLVVLTIYILFQPNVQDGIGFYLSIHWDQLNLGVFTSALGQAFFSLSLAMGIIITYGSYMNKKEDIEKCSLTIVAIDTFVAMLSGLLIVPVVYATYGGNIPSGPTLIFESLPSIFSGMPAATLVAILFFIMVFIAAITSAISIVEAVVSTLMDRLHVTRKKGLLMYLIPMVVMGVIVYLGFGPLDFINIGGKGILDLFDFVTNNIMMPIVAFCTCVFIGHLVGTKVVEDEISSSSKFRLKPIYPFMIKWVAPILILIIFVGGLVS